MIRHHAALRSGLILVFAVVLAGCYDSDVGTIRAEPRAAGQIDRVPSSPAARPSGSKPSRRSADTGDPVGLEELARRYVRT